MSNCGFVSRAGLVECKANTIQYRYNIILIPRDLNVSELVAFGTQHEALMSATDMVLLGSMGQLPECLSLGVRILFPACVGRDTARSEFINGFEVTGKKDWGTRNLTSHGYYTRDLSLALHPYYLLVRTPRA